MGGRVDGSGAAGEQERSRRGTVIDAPADVVPAIFLVPWGLAWLVGYGVLFLRFGPDERVLVSMPEWMPYLLLYVVLAAAGAVSGAAGHRATRGIAGESADRGRMYGWSWAVAFAGFGVFGSQFHSYLPDPQFRLLMSALPVFITGILYMSGGAVWRDRHQFAFGVWLSLINAAGLLAGPGWHSLIVSLLGGGGMLASAAYQRGHRP